MVQCAICKENFSSLKQFKSHFTFYHPGSSYLCVNNGCGRSYQLYNSFRRHYLKQHSDSLEPGLQASNPIEPQSYSSSEVLSTIEFQSCFSNDPSSHMPSTSLTQNKSSTTHYKDMNFITVPLRNTLGPLFSSLYGNPHLPNNVIDTVYHGVENMFNLSIKPFLLKLPGFAMEELVTDLEEFCSMHKRLQYFEKKGSFINPQPYVVGQSVFKLL
ncbi:hypothetical protein ACJJTC_012992 [Scirpophaga incertulas]